MIQKNKNTLFLSISLFISCLLLKLKTFFSNSLISLPYFSLYLKKAPNFYMWQNQSIFGFNLPGNGHMLDIILLHNLIMIFCLFIGIVVGWMFFRIFKLFHHKNNEVYSSLPIPIIIEILWTLIPIMILIKIAAPSFELLYLDQSKAFSHLSLSVNGHQWYWSYEYSNGSGNLIQADRVFDSYMLHNPLRAELRYYAVDEPIVIPTGKNIDISITADDVIHSWALPNAGIKLDGVPGRINKIDMRLPIPGVFFGQCSELCGEQHGFMPIVVRVSSTNLFFDWISQEINWGDVKKDF